MNIMFISDKMSGGGAERVTSILASKLSENNNVYLVSHRDDEKYEIDEHVVVRCLNITKGTNIFNRFVHLFYSVIKIRKMKKDWNINCSISMLSGPNVRNVLSRNHEKVIISIRNKCSENTNLHSFEAKLNSFACRKADWVVALSKAVELDEIEFFHSPKEKTLTIYNPCNALDIKARAASEPNDPLFSKIKQNSDFLVITAGRLVSQKGQWHLIRAFSDVVKKCSNAALVILGKGELKSYLEELIIELGLEKNVFLLGFKQNPYQYMQRADLFVFSSLFEGFGNILLEAMACSLPIVSCDCAAGPRELLAPDSKISKKAKGIEYAPYGILTEVMDGKKYNALDSLTSQEECLSKAIQEMRENVILRESYKKRSEERIADFSTECIIGQWEYIMEN